MVYVRISGRILLNVNALNNVGAAGNYNELSKVAVYARVDDDRLEMFEVPVVSGNMVKHWHFVHYATILYNKIPESHWWCRAFEGVRIPPNEPVKSEEDAIKCPVEDLHGFLHTKSNIKRESLAKFSFMIPVEEVVGEVSITAVTHNRVSRIVEKSSESSAMMVIKQEYTSAPYGFSVLLDLKYLGYAFDVKDRSVRIKKVIDDAERVERGKAAVLALLNLLSGVTGAKIARAFPATKVIEVIAAVSDKPIPAPVHGFYRDYIDETVKVYESVKEIFNADIEILYFGQRKVEGVKRFDNYTTLFKHLADKVASLLSK